MNGWRSSGNPAHRRRGPRSARQKVLRTSLDRYKDRNPDRTEIQGPRGRDRQGVLVRLSASSCRRTTCPTGSGRSSHSGSASRTAISARSGAIPCWPCPRPTGDGAGRAAGTPNETRSPAASASTAGCTNTTWAPTEKGCWTDWVVHVKWSYQSDGILQIWKNGEKVVDQNGPNAFNDAHGPFFKMGLYKGWRNPPTQTRRRDQAGPLPRRIPHGRRRRHLPGRRPRLTGACSTIPRL